MSLIVAILYSVVIPGLVIIGVIRLWRLARAPLTKGFVLIASVTVFLELLWFAGGQKLLLDNKVRAMCAEDGGIRVYHTVQLSPEKFDKFGIVRIPSKQDAKPEDQYYFETNTHYYEQGNPSFRRSHTKIIRKADRSVMGEAVSYHRVGGDLPGPWHSSSFSCPMPTEIQLEKAIFKMAEMK